MCARRFYISSFGLFLRLWILSVANVNCSTKRWGFYALKNLTLHIPNEGDLTLARQNATKLSRRVGAKRGLIYRVRSQ